MWQSPKMSDGSRMSARTVSSNFMYQTETAAESFTPPVRQANGCRLFGIELLDHSSVESGVPVEDSHISIDAAEYEHHSEPSKSDVPSVSCDPDKSCLRSPHSRQIRSCTKVISTY